MRWSVVFSCRVYLEAREIGSASSARLPAKLCCDPCTYFIRPPSRQPQNTCARKANCFCLAPLGPPHRKHPLCTITFAKQPQEFFNVAVNIRMSAVKPKGGGLWVRERAQPPTAFLVWVRVDSGGGRVRRGYSCVSAHHDA